MFGRRRGRAQQPVGIDHGRKHIPTPHDLLAAHGLQFVRSKFFQPHDAVEGHGDASAGACAADQVAVIDGHGHVGRGLHLLPFDGRQIGCPENATQIEDQDHAAVAQNRCA